MYDKKFAGSKQSLICLTIFAIEPIFLSKIFNITIKNLQKGQQ